MGVWRPDSRKVAGKGNKEQDDIRLDFACDLRGHPAVTNADGYHVPDQDLTLAKLSTGRSAGNQGSHLLHTMSAQPAIHLPSETGRRCFTAFGHPTGLGSLHLIWVMWILLISKAPGGTASDWAGEGLVIRIAFH